MIHVTVLLDPKTGNVQLNTSQEIAGNRVLIYGLLAIGHELVHRMGDPQKSPIVVPDLGIYKGLKT